MTDLFLAVAYFLGAALVDSLYAQHTRAIAHGKVARGTVLAGVTAFIGAGGILGMAELGTWLLIPFALGCSFGTFLTLHFKVDDLIGTVWQKVIRGEGGVPTAPIDSPTDITL